MREYIETLSAQFSYDTILILGNGRVDIDTTKLRLQKPAGIQANYQLDGAKIEKNISDANGFNLGKPQLITGTSSPFPRVSVFYMEDINDPFFQPSVLIGSFVPLYVSEDALKIEITAIHASMKNQPQKNKLTEIVNYLTTDAPVLEPNVVKWITEQGLK